MSRSDGWEDFEPATAPQGYYSVKLKEWLRDRFGEDPTEQLEDA